MARRGPRNRGTGLASEVDLTLAQEVPDPQPPHGALVPWALAAILGGLIATAASWILVCGVVMIGWISTPAIDLVPVLKTGTRLWLLGVFAGTTLADSPLTITPLGLSVIHGLICAGMASAAAHQARAAAEDELSQTQRRNIALKVSGLFVLAHVVSLVAISFAVATRGESARALLGSLAISAVASLMASANVCEWHPISMLPASIRSLPRALAAATSVMLLTGCLVLFIALLRHKDQVMALHSALGAGALGGSLAVIAQLLWLPNLIIWCISWALGAGFALGTGTLVSPVRNEVGLLPTIPVFGALPGNGPAPMMTLLWLLSGVVAAALAAWILVSSRARARADETALIGGLVGVLAGGIMIGLAAISGGDLGSVRLVNLGPRLPVLAVIAPTLMGLSGVLTGAITGLVRGSGVQKADRLEV